MSEEDTKDEDDQTSGDRGNAGNLTEQHPTLPQRSTWQKWVQPPCHICDHKIRGECSENWDENRHSPHVSTYALRARFVFLTGKNMVALSELILQMVMYLHAGSHVKPRRVKMHRQMRVGRT